MTPPTFRAGWSADIEPTSDPYVARAVVFTQFDDRQRQYGVYFLAHYPEQNLLEVLCGACPQAFVNP